MKIRSPFSFPACGFTLPELLAVIVIIGVLLAVAAPRFLGSSHNEAVLYQETIAALRYAQSVAITMQRTVCVTFTATSVTFRYVPAYGSSDCVTGPPPGLIPPGGGTAPYQVTAKGSATFTTAPGSFSFDRLGKPSFGAAQTVAVSGIAGAMTIEAESGYVH